MKFVLFIDALDPRDVAQYAPGMAQDMVGDYDVGVPRVTPNIVSQAMTGLPPEEMEMMRSTPMFEPSEDGGFETEDGEWAEGERRVGIHDYTNILSDLDDEGVRLFQYGTPFCAFVDLENGMSVHDEMTNPAAPDFMNFASPPVSFQNDDWDLVADSYISDTVLEFETMKQIARQDNVDTVFLGYKHIDHATHWHAPEIKGDLIRVIWSYIQDLREMGHEVMWWSDHGSQHKEEVLRINKYLAEQGYLSYEIDEDFLEQAEEKGLVERNFEDQLQLSHPAVEVDWEETIAFSSDAFDSMVDVTPHATEDDIRFAVDALNDHPAIANAWRKEDYLNPDGEKFWFAPEIIVERGDGVLVTGNIDPDAETYVDDVPKDWEEFPEDNMGMRPGVHSRWGCYGGDIEDVEIDEPWELRDVMYNFVNPEEISSDGETDVSQREDVPEDRLEALGYL